MKTEEVFSQFPILETKRLLLRALVSRDAPAILTLYGDDKVTRFHPETPFATMDRAEAFINFCRRAFDEQRMIRWGVAPKPDDWVVGTVGLHHFDELHDRVEIGFDIASDYWRRGYGFEAVGTVLRFAFERLDVNRVEAHTMRGNIASIQLLEKLGFCFEGILRQYGYWKGTYHDVRLFSLLKQDYGGDYVSGDFVTGQNTDSKPKN